MTRIPLLALRPVTATVLLSAIFSPAAAEEPLNTLSEQDRKAGWTLLFDGQSADQWRNYKKDAIGDGWKIVDGALVRAAGGAGDIITKQQFDSFEFSVEYRISKGGNSGIMYHVTEEEPAPYMTGPEIQVQDNVDGRDPQKSGWLYQLYPADIDATKPAGEWNEVRIKITPAECVTYMNGVRYAQYVKGSKDWDERVAKSKFTAWKNFGKPTKGHICLQDHGNEVAYRNIKIREIGPDFAPSISDGQLPLRAEIAFPNLEWTGWSPEGDDGKVVPLRPIVLTNAGDGSNRLFVATQHGVIHVFPNDQQAKQTKVFLDITDRVIYNDNQNEEGFLGLAFHPKYKETGEFIAYYTTRNAPHTSVISRFRVSKDNPDQADKASEEVLLTVEQPFWNHNGGTVAFGPDGYLYIALGDGGAGNDPHENGQNLGTLLGAILRIDVDNKHEGLNYAIPADNPFVGQKGARGEIWAYGLRNVWRMSFDRETGNLWAADVGQNLWEEINIIRRGGNYGWNLREGKHMFGAKGVAPNPDLVEPIFEYEHEVGKSITGGCIYRGQRFPDLQGAYLYADYITGKVWALRYDADSGQVVGNNSIQTDKLPIITFGEDEAGEVYFTMVTASGKGIFRLAPLQK